MGNSRNMNITEKQLKKLKSYIERNIIFVADSWLSKQLGGERYFIIHRIRFSRRKPLFSTGRDIRIESIELVTAKRTESGTTAFTSGIVASAVLDRVFYKTGQALVEYTELKRLKKYINE